ncbi:MAG: sugar ABC transporter permease [Clostridiales bacterium]|nr:sugar ABC transporter permease [Clostridiales bacterium]
MNQTTAPVKTKKPPKPPKAGKSRLRSRENLWGYLFTAPWVLGFFLFFAYPLVYSIQLALSRMADPAAFTLEFNHFENFINAFTRDEKFLPLLGQSLGDMLIKTPVVVVFSLFIAILLNRNLKGKGIFRVFFFLPVLLGTGIVLSTINGSLGADSAQAAQQAAQEAATGGEVQGFSSSIGLTSMLLGPDIAMALENILQVVTDVLWMSGIQIVIFLGALQTIPSSYYEAAYCDGASEWEKFWKITLPLTMPNILLNTVYTMIDYLSSTQNEVVKYCRDTGLTGNNVTFGSALGWVYFLSSGLIILIVFLILKRFTFYADE